MLFFTAAISVVVSVLQLSGSSTDSLGVSEDASGFRQQLHVQGVPVPIRQLLLVSVLRGVLQGSVSVSQVINGDLISAFLLPDPLELHVLQTCTAAWYQG